MEQNHLGPIQLGTQVRMELVRALISAFLIVGVTTSCDWEDEIIICTKHSA